MTAPGRRADEQRKRAALDEARPLIDGERHVRRVQDRPEAPGPLGPLQHRRRQPVTAGASHPGFAAGSIG
jgi:hypothetical protein